MSAAEQPQGGSPLPSGLPPQGGLPPPGGVIRFWRDMRLAREGWGIVGAVALLVLLATVGAGWAAWPGWLLLLFFLQFFRDPIRAVNANVADNVVLAPADGRVVFVGRADAPIADGGERIKISVFMNVFNVHSNRAPVSGGVVRSQRFAGKFFNAALDKSSTNNERHLLGIKTPSGEIFCVQIAGLLARRVFCYAAVGDMLSAGARYGFIRFGSRVDVYLPPACRPTVTIGDHVAAGIHAIAELSPAAAPASAAAPSPA